jgi:predicted transcriptional regulator
MVMTTALDASKRVVTTDMQVTSIRLETELKEKLKELAGGMGYQQLIREVLWQYVQQQGQERNTPFSAADIRATIAATAQNDEICSLTGEVISVGQPMWLGLTFKGELVPLSSSSLS